MSDTPAIFTFADDQLFTFPTDPDTRLFTAQELFAFAILRIVNRDGLELDADVPVLDIFAILDAGFADGTVVPVIDLG